MQRIDPAPDDSDFTTAPSIIAFLSQFAMMVTEEEAARQLEAAYGDRVPGGGPRWLDQNRPGWRVCSVKGCERENNARGWCRMHLDRWRRTGYPLGRQDPRWKAEHLRPVLTVAPTPAEVRAEMVEALDQLRSEIPR